MKGRENMQHSPTCVHVSYTFGGGGGGERFNLWATDCNGLQGLPTPAQHPVSGEPFHMLHPCRTLDFMAHALSLSNSGMPKEPDITCQRTLFCLSKET